MSDPCRVRVSGPLVAYVDGFREELFKRGYRSSTVTDQLHLVAHLSRWMGSEVLGVGDLTPARVDQFVETRRATGYRHRRSLRALLPLLDHLRGLAVLPVPPPIDAVTAADCLVRDYRHHLVVGRGLAPSTVRFHLSVAALFLSEWSKADGLDLERLAAGDVVAFAVRECRRRQPGSAKGLATSLRSLLRFLYAAGWTPWQLAEVVPSVAVWGGGSLPRALPAVQVTDLLGSCDLGSVVGRRDYAILTVLSRLGLRAGEVAGLRLDDVDWRQGEILIRGKGSRLERLPLPVDVGEAIVAYLHDGRPRVECRSVFLRVCAPIVGLTPVGVSSVVIQACARAGIPPSGAHRLRHSAATAMLQAGSSLAEVGQVLRQSSVATTAVYAKVDRVALRGLA